MAGQGAGMADGSGILPADLQRYFGTGLTTFRPPGNVLMDVSGAGVSPVGTAADKVLSSLSIAAGAFDVAGRGIYCLAAGTFAVNANTKTIKLLFNPASATVGSTVGASGTLISTSGAVTTSGGAWVIEGWVYKYGARASNTQLGFGKYTGGVYTVPTSPIAATATESGAIFMAVTGNAATTNTDIVWNFFQIQAFN